MTTASIIRDLASGNQTGCTSLIDVHTPFGTWAHQAPAVHRHHLEGQGPSPRKLGNALQLVAANNLSDVVSVATARTNLWTWIGGYHRIDRVRWGRDSGGGGYPNSISQRQSVVEFGSTLAKANDLSDVANAATSLSNIGGA